MGMFRDSGSQEIDIIKEMAEGLGNTGARVEELLEKALEAKDKAQILLDCYHDRARCDPRPEISVVNESIQAFNSCVDKAEDALRWLLIQREACGFRTHRNVTFHYPIPPKMKPIKP
jgi:hypothetical protein